MYRKYKDVVSAVIIFMAGLIYFILSFSIRQYGDAAVDSSFLPRILGGLLLLLSSVQIVSGIRKANAISVSDKDSMVGHVGYLPVVLTLLLMFAYAAGMKPLGFLLSTIAFVFFQALVLIPKKQRNYIVISIVSVVFSVAVYLVFTRVFSLVLPHGILG